MVSSPTTSVSKDFHPGGFVTAVMGVKALVAAFVLGVISVTSGHAGTFVNTGQSVTGTTTTLPLDVSKVTPSPGSVSLSNSGGNLVVTFNSAAPNGDFYLMWQAAAGGLNFNTANYNYVQINIAAVSPGMTNSAWQMYWQDDDSTVGGVLDSGITIGNVAPQAQPFSVVIDLKDGGTNVTGAKGWGPGTLDVFRIDPFQGVANKGQSFTISSITFGTQLTSLSGTGRNNTFTVTHKYAATVNGYFTTPHQIKARTFYEQFKIIDAYDPATITLSNQLGYGPGSQTADVFVPTTYEATKPVGIYIHINAGDSAGLPSNLDAVLEKHYLIGASPDKAGNDRHDSERYARVVDLATTLKTKYNIDRSRVYVGGISGGALTSVFCGMIYPDVFTGIIATEHVMSYSCWSRIYTLGEMFEMASHGQRWSHILGKDSYAWSSLAPLSTSWKYSVIIDSNRTPTRVNYDPFFDTYNQFVPGMAHSNPAPYIFEKSLVFVEAPSQRPRVTHYDDWEKYAFRLDDPESVYFSFNVGETPRVAGDPTIHHLPEDDFDGDGIKNWIEYLVNTDPTIANDAPFTPLLSISGKEAVLQYRTGALDQQTVIHTSTDLINWDTTGNGAQMMSRVLNPGETLGTTRFAPSTVGLPNFFYKAVISRQSP